MHVQIDCQGAAPAGDGVVNDPLVVVPNNSLGAVGAERKAGSGHRAALDRDRKRANLGACDGVERLDLVLDERRDATAMDAEIAIRPAVMVVLHDVARLDIVDASRNYIVSKPITGACKQDFPVSL